MFCPVLSSVCTLYNLVQLLTSWYCTVPYCRLCVYCTTQSSCIQVSTVPSRIAVCVYTVQPSLPAYKLVLYCPVLPSVCILYNLVQLHTSWYCTVQYCRLCVYCTAQSSCIQVSTVLSRIAVCVYTVQPSLPAYKTQVGTVLQMNRSFP